MACCLNRGSEIDELGNVRLLNITANYRTRISRLEILRNSSGQFMRFSNHAVRVIVQINFKYALKSELT